MGDTSSEDEAMSGIGNKNRTSSSGSKRKRVLVSGSSSDADNDYATNSGVRWDALSKMTSVINRLKKEQRDFLTREVHVIRINMEKIDETVKEQENCYFMVDEVKQILTKQEKILVGHSKKLDEIRGKQIEITSINKSGTYAGAVGSGGGGVGGGIKVAGLNKPIIAEKNFKIALTGSSGTTGEQLLKEIKSKIRPRLVLNRIRCVQIKIIRS